MSNLVCPGCRSTNIMTERRPNGYHICIDCHNFWSNGIKPKQTVFKKITQSPETLAEKLVYREKWTITSEHPEKGKEYEYWSTPFIDDLYPTREEAIAATVAKLNEVAECHLKG